MSWQNFSLSHIIELAGFVLTMWTLHKQNVSKMAKIESKLDLMYNWFRHHIMKAGSDDES